MYFLVASILLWLFWPRLRRRIVAWRQASPEERSFATRFAIFSGVMAFIFVAAILFLPNKGKVILLIPVFLVGTSLARWWENARGRRRRKTELNSNFDRARRIN